MNRKFSHRAAAPLGALFLAASAHAGGMQTNDAWTGADKTKHLSVGFAIGGAVTAMTGRPLYGFAAGTAIGALKELSDAHSTGHTSSFQDFAVTAAGAAIGAYTGGVVLTYYRGRTGVAITKEF